MKLIMHYAMAGVSLLLCFVVGTTVLVVNSLAAPIPLPGEEPDQIVRLTPPQPNSKINVLVLGVDEGLLPGGIRASTRSDTIMLASFDPRTGQLNVLSVPRDSRVIMPGRDKANKMGHAHAYGGVSLVVDTLELLLDVPIHYYMRVDHSGFRRLIDVIGGVDYYVERDMFYEDPYQDLYIDLKKGQQRLDGSKAEQYVRYRGVNGSDIDRIGRQQKFLIAAIRQALKPANLLKVNSLIDIVMRSVHTNIDSVDVLKFLPHLDGFSDTKVITHVLPGDNAMIDGSWYWAIDRAAMDEILAAGFWEDLQGDPRSVRVKIVDATGSGQGNALAERMSRRGFVVVDVEQATDIVEKTTITAHDGNDPAALMVFRFIKFGDLFSEVSNGGIEYDNDVTIVLGTDL